MAKAFIDVVQDFPRTGLCIPFETKTPSTEPYFRPRYRVHKRMVSVLIRKRLFRHPFARIPLPRLRARSANQGVMPVRRT